MPVHHPFRGGGSLWVGTKYLRCSPRQTWPPPYFPVYMRTSISKITSHRLTAYSLLSSVLQVAWLPAGHRPVWSPISSSSRPSPAIVGVLVGDFSRGVRRSTQNHTVHTPQTRRLLIPTTWAWKGHRSAISSPTTRLPPLSHITNESLILPRVPGSPDPPSSSPL